jgi:FkbM family methyltransferase
MSRNPSTLFFRAAPAESKAYPSHVRTFHCEEYGKVEFAEWQHPSYQQTDFAAESLRLRELVQPGDFVLEIGAHAGGCTVPLALAAGSTGLVLALEPDASLYPVLAENARLNATKTHIDARHLAVSDTDGQFEVPQGWPLFRRRPPLQVEGRNLYYMLKTEFPSWLPKLKYVRVDAEGHDLKILESIRPILSERRPAIACEVFGKLVASERLAIYDFLDHLGYNLTNSAAPTGSDAPLPRQAITRIKAFDLLATPRPPRPPRRYAA